MNARPQLTPAQSRRAIERGRERERLEAEVRRVVQEVAPDLLSGTPRAGLTERQLNTVLNNLSERKGNYQLRASRRALRRLLSQLEKVTGGKVAKPAVELTLRRRPSPFAGRSIERIQNLNAVLDSFFEFIDPDPHDAGIKAAQILLAAITLGGLLARPLVLTLPSALRTGLGSHGTLLWVEFTLDDGQLRRWFPDPVTSCLIARWYRAGREWPRNRAPLQLVFDHLRRLSGGREAPFRNFEELRAASEARLRLMVPGLLVDHLISIRQGQSLPPRAWWRLLADYQISALEPLPEEEEELMEPPRAQPASAIKAPLQMEGLEPTAALLLFMKALRDQHGKLLRSQATALRRLTSFRDTMPDAGPMLQELMGWAIWLLEPGKSPRLRPSSVHRYLTSIAAPLLNMAGEVDPTQAPGIEMEHIYDSVLQSTHSTRARVMAVSCLRSFHAYLILAHGVQQAEIDGQSTWQHPVRANVISDREYMKIRRRLQDADQLQLDLMLILLYRLGLRRSELLFIQLSDFQFDKEGVRPLLWIHSHPGRRVKSTSSTRRMPLQQLLTVPERAALHEHFKRRLIECGRTVPANALLFARSGNDTCPVPDRELEELIQTIRSVCKDPTLVLHSLRHSFVTNLFGDIMRAGLLEPGQQACMPWRTSPPYHDPLKALFRTNDVPRGAAYTIAVLAGHLGPSESLHSYVHLHDYFAYQFLCADATRHPSELWARLEGVRTDSLHVRASRRRAKGEEIPQYVDTPARLLKRCRLPQPPGQYALHNTPASKLSEETAHKPIPVSLEHVYRSIARSTVFMSRTSRTHVTGFSATFQNQLMRNARALASVRTAAPNTASRRPRLIGKMEPRRRPAIFHRPQLDGLGPALPRSVEGLREARLAFERAVTDESGAIQLKALLGILMRSSHSKPWVRISRVQHAARIVRILSALAVPYGRMRLRIMSLPADCEGPAAWLKYVSTTVGVRECLVELATPVKDLPRSRVSNQEGVIHLEVSGTKRLSTGWRVGCYYSTCYLATCNDVELSELLFRGELPTAPRN